MESSSSEHTTATETPPPPPPALEGRCDGDGLAGWERLLEQRRRLHRRLGRRLGRRPGELLMNASDEVRPVREDKLLLEGARVPQHFDPYRGNPAFWKLPPGLPVPCHPEADPVHFYATTREQRNELPEVEYVGVPDRILEEKDVMPRTRNLRKSWKKLKYRQERTTQLDDKIKYMEPHKPEMENLLVIGTGIRMEPSQSNIELGEKSEENVFVPAGSRPEAQEQIPRIALIMNGVTITNISCHTAIPTITINSVVDITSNRLVIQDLTIENVGQTAVRLSWKKHKRHSLFSSFGREEDPVPCFFFDINDIIVIPKQTITIPIIMRITAPRSYAAVWQITTKPNLSQNDYHILFRITCYGFIRGLERKAGTITNRIDTTTKNSVIKEVVKDVLANLKYTATPMTTLHYTEEQVFESINYDDHVLQKNKKYVYNKAVIDKLKEFYRRIWHEGWPDEWNLCLEDLKKLARQADLKAYAESVKEKGNAASLAREHLQKQKQILAVDRNPSKGVVNKKSAEVSRSKLKAAARSSSSVVKSEKSVEKNLNSKTSKIGSKSRSHTVVAHESAYKTLRLILNQLRKPDILPNLDRERYFQLVSVAGTYITKMCYGSELLQYKILHRFTSCDVFINPVNRERPPRLVYEVFDDIFLVDKTHKLALKKNCLIEAPRPDTLMDIPDDDIDHLYATYYGETYTSTHKLAAGKSTSKTGKGDKKGADKGKAQDKKKGDKDKGKKGADKEKAADKKGDGKDTSKDGKKSTKGQSSTQSMKKMKHEPSAFDPFAEHFVISPKHESSKEIKAPSIQKVETSCTDIELSLYSHNIYVTFHTYLCQAVDMLTEVCDQFRSDMTSTQLVHELIGGDLKCGKVTPQRYKALIHQEIKYPPAKENLEEDEGVKTHLIKGIVKPTRSETRRTSLWSIMQNYIPEPETPPEPVPTPEESIVEELSLKDMDVQASFSFEAGDSLRSDEKIDVAKENSKSSTQPSSSVSFQYFYVDE